MVRVTGKGSNILAADLSFQAGKEYIREALTIVMSEPSNSGDAWRVVVEGHIAGGGVFVVGSFTTRPPRSGDPSNRVVALAYLPGVSSWKIYVFGPRGAKAQFQLSSGRHAESGNRALVAVNGTRLERRIWDPSPSQLAFAQQGLLSPGPASLVKAYGFLEPAAAPSLYVGFVDKLAPAVNGDRFIVAPTPVPNVWPRVFSFVFDPDGVPFTSAIRWVVSTNPLVVTLGGAGDLAVVQGERV